MSLYLIDVRIVKTVRLLVSLIAMPSLEKGCPDCGTIVHVRKLRCPCGHVFRKFKSNSTVRKQALESTRIANAASQTRKRALETKEESEQRKKTNAASQAHRRALETEKESEQRKKADTARLAYKRALETEDETKELRLADRTRAAKRRALESEKQSEERRLQSKRIMVNKRHRSSPLQCVIDSFVAKTKQGPDYV